MSENYQQPNLSQPLTIGNIINVGLQIYRANFKLYSKLALTAHLWLFIPIYGWAKFYVISALISRLVFSNLTNQPETIKTAQDKTNPSLWKLFILGIIIFLMPLIFAFLWLLLFSLIFGIIYAVVNLAWGITLPQPPKDGNLFENWQSAAIWLSIAIAVYLSPLWHYSRLFITELTLVIEDNSNPFKAIKQSWELTKGLRMRLITIIIVSFTITFPVWIIVWRGLGEILRLISYNFLRYLIDDFSIRAILLTIILNIMTGVIIMPFWQSLKAVVYYDIRCRRESLDLQLRVKE
ncbi:MAG TPA: hypothetical protein DEG17_14245 [Cyanobacteria bacterium UBA11149]|nr:hypothetical protein [Cyanobacteria bacterium UBA11367]HBE56947.1 hypothetical protein [Cyanobacteria bacterium UBA11366]HBK62176.1 hypothetical protein [Cyanobacteria bacterium UBA11166]HBR73391.1 hypothetical protein [Cyanobacteria bacterium UBA11159]HBS67641.1 hypothetical protein [Cyanobacteria bacterium UBA11153]HBW89999.1 hypothetical protein [Cyanobacteria bacterium UBA11149]HCA96444.1 hypothetical protein [Cyanobacteria bacterium UBA9226]